MKRKIKITESQYNKLKQSLVETPFDKLAKNTIKVGDVIEINDSGKKSSFKVLQSYGGQITMEGISSDVVKYIYTITSTSLHGNELGGYYIDKVRYSQNPKDIKNWPKINKQITDFQVFRNNKLIDAADFNGKSSFNPNLPAPIGAQTAPNSPNNLPVPSDDAEKGYHPYEELPNDGTTPSSGSTQPDTKEPYEKEYYPYEEVDDTPPDAPPTPEDNEKVNKIVDVLSGKDPVLQKLFFKQASWMEHLNAELKGKKATHGGITATYDMLSYYVRNHIDKETPGFHEGKKVKYFLLTPVSLQFQKKIRNLNIEANVVLEGEVLPLEFGDTKRVIFNREDNYFITIVQTTNKYDVFKCRISKTKSHGNITKEYVNIEFQESDGYTTVQNQEKNK